MMKNLLLLFTLFFCSIFYANGQHYSEMLNYSLIQAGGSSRTVGVAGSLSALGADFGAITQNPAGLGRYRRSEFSISLGFNNVSNTGTFAGLSQTEKDGIVDLPSMGLVITSRPRDVKWKNMNFSIGYNKQIHYGQTIYYEGDVPGSLMQKFAADAEGYAPDELDDFGDGLAYEVGGIFDFDNDLIYDSDIQGTASETPFSHAHEIAHKGSMGELGFALGGNYDDKLFVGLSVGIPIINNNITKIFTEEDKGDEIGFFDEMKYEDQLNTTGSGVNVKFGFNYQVSDNVYAGLALHSPTWLSLTDTYTTFLDYTYTDASGTNENQSQSPDGSFTYAARTPWRAIVNAGMVVAKKGFVSADVELVDYRNASFNFTKEFNNAVTREEERLVNNAIEDNFKQTMNVRIGGEFAPNNLRLRAGVGLYGSPYEGNSAMTTSYHAGVGFRVDNFFVDLAYRLTNTTEGFSPYEVREPLEPIEMDLTKKQSTVQMTVGLKF